MTPVYVSVIYLFLHSFPSETSPEHFKRVFSTCAVRKTKSLGTEWMLVVDRLIFRHGVFPAVKSNQVENAPCDVTREILLIITHTPLFRGGEDHVCESPLGDSCFVMNIHNPFMHCVTSQYVFKLRDVIMLMRAVTIEAA